MSIIAPVGILIKRALCAIIIYVMKFVLGIIGVIFAAIIVIVLLISGGGDRPAERPLIVSEEAREGVSAVLTTQGQVVGQDQRRAIRVIVNQNERRLEILTGYEEAVERSSTFPNTHAGFETFLAALQQAGFGRKRPTAIDDERGACPLGRQYIYELREYSQELLRSWSSTCSNQGDFAGRGSTVRTLFEKQIPDYSRLVRGVDLSGSQVTDSH